MGRSDFPGLEARAAKLRDELRPILTREAGEGFGVTILVERDSMISALEELVLNLRAERAMGDRAPTVVEALQALRSAVLHFLESSEEHVSEAEALRRASRLADLVGYKPPKKGSPSA